MSVEDNYNETFVARLASREKQMQQHYRPVISVHKWFARRPGSLFRALALAEFAEGRVDSNFRLGHSLDGVCLDPFMGGGTPVFEAARLGMATIGYDTNPMARWVVERELEDVDPEQFRDAGERIAADVEAELAPYYKTACPTCGDAADVRYFLWLRHHHCVCEEDHPLLADTMLVSTGLKRHPREVHLCPHCLQLDEFKAGRRTKKCRNCGGDFEAGLVPADSERVCSCGRSFRIPPNGTIETPLVKLVAMDYCCSNCSAKGQRAYKAADAQDQALHEKAARGAAENPSPFWPDQLIPSGAETERLLRWGYLRWADLFNPRQLLGLGTLAARINEEPAGPVRRALQTAFSDFVRYQTMLCRYDRQALKPTDVFAVHGFPVPRISCEPHLLGVRGAGSGGFRHALAKYERAKRWSQAPYETVPEDGRLRRYATKPERLAAKAVTSVEELRDGTTALLRRASLSTDDLPENSVDVVLTDPPYYANVQYAELMDFCFAWLRRLAPDTEFFDSDGTKSELDAVGSDCPAGVDLIEFTRRLSEVFVAAAQALKPGHAFIFTYHHNELDAYAPLVVACRDAGLIPTRLYGCPSEMRQSKHIHGRNASTVDTVFVLRKPPVSTISREFTSDSLASAVDARLGALRRAGLKPTAADRACIRYSLKAAAAMTALSVTWDSAAPVGERVADALCALGGAATSVPAVAA